MNAPARDDLEDRLLAVIERGASATLSADSFNALAIEVFAHQFGGNPIYRAYCLGRGVSPADVERWQQIPALPADAFKAAPLVCGDPAAAAVVFRTSGTTRGGDRRGEHYLMDTTLYEAALSAGFAEHLLPEGNSMRILSLVPSRGSAPDSSLAFMASEVIERFGTAESDFYISAAELRAGAFIHAAMAAIEEDEAVLVVGTSLAFVHLLGELDKAGEYLELPRGSRAMDTGGFKTREREVSRVELYDLIRTRLGIPAEWIVNEYGMTEMSSQLYDGVAGEAGAAEGRVYRSPPWVRTVAVDPESLDLLAPGEVGVLRHIDLANLDSIAAIQTADLGRVTERGVELLGRLRGAEARGCSLAMEDLAAVLEGRVGA